MAIIRGTNFQLSYFDFMLGTSRWAFLFAKGGLKMKNVVFTTILLASVLVQIARGEKNVIEQKTIDVSFPAEELSLTCRMGLNGLSYISLNAPTLNKELDANVRLKQTAVPVLHLTSPFLGTSSYCQEANVELTKFIVASGGKAVAQLKISLVEATASSFGVTSRILSENFVLELNDQLKFYNGSSILLEKRKDTAN